LSLLPSIGQKSAQRLAYFLMNQDKNKVEDLAGAISLAREKIVHCSVCFNYTERELCKICDNPRREQNVICVVERPADILLVEKFGFYNGVFHILGGNISPIDGVGPNELNFAPLKSRIQKFKSPEVILALSTNTDGESTIMYLIKYLADTEVKISRLARGIPLGSDLQYVDEMTMQKAMENRVIL